MAIPDVEAANQVLHLEKTGRDNLFDLARLIAAWLVLLSHSYPLWGLAEPRVAGQFSLGTIGVLIFFAISGDLNFASLLRAGSASVFLANRVLRIWPGLLVSLLVCAFLLGPLLTTEPIRTYLASSATRWFVIGAALRMV